MLQKPPHIPVARKRRISGDIFVRSLSAKTNPMVKQPIIFMPKVPNGKVERNFVWMNCEIEYRKTPPIKLPVPINNKIFISSLLFEVSELPNFLYWHYSKIEKNR
jgi:hypothetical protein